MLTPRSYIFSTCSQSSFQQQSREAVKLCANTLLCKHESSLRRISSQSYPPHLIPTDYVATRIAKLTKVNVLISNRRPSGLTGNWQGVDNLKDICGDYNIHQQQLILNFSSLNLSKTCGGQSVHQNTIRCSIVSNAPRHFPSDESKQTGRPAQALAPRPLRNPGCSIERMTTGLCLDTAGAEGACVVLL
jgi:hypothetical protein